MALQKQPLNISFAEGLDLKTDPFQVKAGKFLELVNSVFEKGGRLSKRNGFPELPQLPDTSFKFVSTFNSGLVAIGDSLSAFSSGTRKWVDRGDINIVDVRKLGLVHSSNNQIQADSAISPNGLICTAYTDSVPVAGVATSQYKYTIADQQSGQIVVSPTSLSGTVTGSPRVFLLRNYFMIVYSVTVAATPTLVYIAINIYDTSSVSAVTTVSSSYTPASTVAFDGVVANETLFLAWNGADGGGAVRMTAIDSSLNQLSPKIFAGETAGLMSVTADTSGSTPVIYATYFTTAGDDTQIAAVNSQLDTVLAPTNVLNNTPIVNVSTVAVDQVATVFYELPTTYSYGTSEDTHVVSKVTVTQAGAVGTPAVVKRSVGLASKAFLYDDYPYFLGVYDSVNQPTNFLIDGAGNILAKLAYQNAGPYKVLGLPNVVVQDELVHIPYLVKELLIPVSKEQGADVANGIYAQLGVDMAIIDMAPDFVATSEIGGNLHLSGGFLWAFDGVMPVEQGFFLYPDNVFAEGDTTGGTIAAGDYFYQALYEWSDNQGNIFRSAPSIPVSVTTTGATSSVEISVPTLRLTLKTNSNNPVKIMIYRASTAQPTYYQITSVTVPTLSDPTVDSVTYTDTVPDSAIIGNSILYTTGGVVENIAPSSVAGLCLFKNRLWVINGENRNSLGYSKEVIEATPVEMSDLFTRFVAPTTGAQNDTGPTTAISAMDDKLIVFKENAIYYITGDGPDITGANGTFSEPVFITSAVGCDNPASIVVMPQGIMFRSSTKGIWLLGRDLSTSYIGEGVEDFNSFTVLSAVNVPGTNQVRFTLSNGSTLMFDYFYGQWGEFEGIPGISSTVYEGAHTFINQYGKLYQEREGSYIDGSNPVLMRFKTSWINLAGLQGFQRAYGFYLLGQYISPHKLNVEVAFDYSPSPEQAVQISPDNYGPAWGGEALWGSGTAWGGPARLENWRIFFNRQKCESFQIAVTEVYDPSFGVVPGAGLTLSGLCAQVGIKDGAPRIKAANSIG
jgi:hypothetical protein